MPPVCDVMFAVSSILEYGGLTDSSPWCTVTLVSVMSQSGLYFFLSRLEKLRGTLGSGLGSDDAAECLRDGGVIQLRMGFSKGYTLGKQAHMIPT